MNYKKETHGYLCPHCVNDYKDKNNGSVPPKPHFFASVPTLRSHFTRFHKGAEKVKTKDVIDLSESVYNTLKPKEKVYELPADQGIKLNKMRDCVCCLTEADCGVIVPCGHTNICAECAATLMGQHTHLRKCPTCRQKIDYYWQKPTVYCSNT